MGVGAEVARSLRAMSGKIAHLSNQQTSDFRKQFRGKQPVSVRPGVAHDILVVVVGGGGVPFKATHPTWLLLPCLAVLCAVCAVCARKLLLSIENSTEKPKKKRTKINETNPERGNPVPCHAFLMKCRRLRNILWHDLIVVLLCLRATRQRVKRGRQVVSNV